MASMSCTKDASQPVVVNAASPTTVTVTAPASINVYLRWSSGNAIKVMKAGNRTVTCPTGQSLSAYACASCTITVV